MTLTGRKTGEPNMQNIPIRTPGGKKIRKAFTMRNEMKTIHKFPIDGVDQIHKLPYSSFKPIHVGDDSNGVPCLWAITVPSDEVTVSVRIHVVGTGHEVPDNIDAEDYVGTFIIKPFVWHIFCEVTS